jgi:hypothetical protein
MVRPSSHDKVIARFLPISDLNDGSLWRTWLCRELVSNFVSLPLADVGDLCWAQP